jgi:ABC-2 type transport system ATP-binding protein
VEELLRQYRLESCVQQLAETLSGGQKQRLALACAVVHRPELLLLDEPTSAVDPESRRDFWEKLFGLADDGTTILVSTHYMDEAERCHRLAILDRGRLVADGTPDELAESLQGRSLRVRTREPHRAGRRLQSLPGVASVAQIGLELRVLLREPGDAFEQVQDEVRRDDPAAVVERVAPNLEDVFVAATRGDSPREEAT